MTGPYETESQARAERMPRDVAAVHAAGQVRSGDPDRLARNIKLAALVSACNASGVALGALDRQVLDHLAGLRPEVVQVLVGLIRRAHAAGTGRG